MILPTKVIHPTGEPEFTPKKSEIRQLAFFIQYLKMGHRFMPWDEDCPLRYTSPNAPKKIHVLGPFVLSILAGYTRYAQITRI